MNDNERGTVKQSSMGNQVPSLLRLVKVYLPSMQPEPSSAIPTCYPNLSCKVSNLLPIKICQTGKKCEAVIHMSEWWKMKQGAQHNYNPSAG